MKYTQGSTSEKDTTNYQIFGELDDIKSNYETTSLEKFEGLYRSQRQVIKMCEYYSDSKYLSKHYGNVYNGTKRPVPFYNIVNYRVALAKTATDLDIKDIQIVSDNPQHQTHSMLLNREAYEWMKMSEFSLVLNQMGLYRPKYGGYLVKKTEDKDGELKIEVVRWTNVWTDQNDILGGAIVECHHMSPVEIKKKSGVWDNVTEVLKAHKGMKKNKPTSIEVYEVTGEFPVAYYKDAEQMPDITEEDMFTYSLQKYYIAIVDGKKYKMFCDELKGEMTDYYEYLAWEENGYGLGRGVIEDSEESQVWTNDAVINESIAMNLAGRAGIITNSSKIGNSVLEHDHGKVYQIEDNKTAVAFNIVPAALGQYQNQIDKWNKQATDTTSSFDSVTGEQPPAGTPYSQTVFLNQVASRPFDYKREEWGIHLSKIFNSWVIPYLVKKIKKNHILVSEFSDTELEAIDESFANLNANRDMVEAVLAENYDAVNPDNQAMLQNDYKDHIKKQGKKRFIDVPDDYFNDIEAKVTVITTGEQKNKAVILQSLSSIMQTVVSSFNPQTGEFGVLTDPTLSKIFNNILELSGAGISPASLGKGTTPTAEAPEAPPPTSAPVQAGLSNPGELAPLA